MATIEDLLKRQVEFETQMQKSMENFMNTIAQTITTQNDEIQKAVDAVSETVSSPLTRLVGDFNVEGKDGDEEASETQQLAQLPLSFRYRNDGASGVHRLEYIRAVTPYSDDAQTTFWPDDEWTAIPGADAVIYSP